MKTRCEPGCPDDAAILLVAIFNIEPNLHPETDEYGLAQAVSARGSTVFHGAEVTIQDGFVEFTTEEWTLRARQHDDGEPTGFDWQAAQDVGEWMLSFKGSVALFAAWSTRAIGSLFIAQAGLP